MLARIVWWLCYFCRNQWLYIDFFSVCMISGADCLLLGITLRVDIRHRRGAARYR